MKAKKILVAAVDVDDDLGRLGIKGPVVGREKVLDAAIKFGLMRPEDSDLNTIFTALSIADMLKSQSLDVEVAILTGSPSGGVEADMKIRKQMMEIASKEKIDGVVLVVDSPEDEKVIPIIQDIVPVISIKKVVVEQSRGLEQTYVLLHKFIKKVTEERKFAKYVLGIPGIIIFVFSLFSITGLITYSIPVLGLILGLYMIVKGYGIDEMVSRWWRSNPISAATSMIAFSSVIIALFVAYLTISQYKTVNVRLVGDVIANSLPFVSVAVAVLILSKMIDKIRRKDLTVWREATAVTALAAATLVITEVGKALSSLPSNSSYSEALRKLLSPEIARVLMYATISVLAVAGAMALLERWVIEREEGKHSRPEPERRA